MKITVSNTTFGIIPGDAITLAGHGDMLAVRSATSSTLSLASVPQWWFTGGPYVTIHRMRLRDMSYSEFRRKRRRK